MADLDDLCGRVLGDFVLRERLDQGGFGTVYRADQPALGRAAVVKVLRRRARSRDVSVQRFAREALLSGQLDHPYAAHVYAFGVEDDGLVWIAMELIQGSTLSRWLAERRCMPLEQFVPFFERLAEVVHAAHERGIVHRDLKPSNVMLIERAGQLLPKLLDFGVAALLEGVTLPQLAATEALVLADETPRELAAAGGTDGVVTVRLRPSTTPNRRGVHRLTRASAAIGSPPYMAPEQWTGSEPAPAMDLYALGVLAYEALVGHRPFIADTAAEYADLHRRAAVPSLGEDLAALDATLRRALAKEPGERFHSALAFASAMRAELEARMVAQIRTSARQWHDRGRPRGLLWRDDALADLVHWMSRTGAGALSQLELDFAEASSAQEDDVAESRRRRTAWVRRGAVTAVIVTLLVAIAVLQDRATQKTRDAEDRASLMKQFADLSVRQGELEQGRAALLHGEVVEAEQHLSDAYRRGDHSTGTEFMFARALQTTLAEQMRFAAHSGRMWSAVFSPDGTRIVTTDDDHAEIWDIATRTSIAKLPHAGSVYQALYSRDGSRIYTASADGSVRAWNGTDGSLIETLRAGPDGGKPAQYAMLALAPDAEAIAAIDAQGDRVEVWGTKTGSTLASLRLMAGGFPSIAFSNDGRYLSAGNGKSVVVVSTDSWKTTTTIPGPRIHTLALHPQQSWVATGSVSGDVSIWDVRTGTRVQHVRDAGEQVDRVAFSPDGQLLAVASRDGAEQIWHVKEKTLQSTGVRLQGSTLTLEFDSTSRFLLAAGGAGVITVADATIGMAVAKLEGAKGAIYSAHFGATSRYIVSASWDGTSRLWDAKPPYRSWAAAAVSDDCGSVGGVNPDGRFIAIGCRDLPTRVWDTAEDRLVAELPSVTHVEGDYLSAYPVVSTDGNLAAIARGNRVELYEVPGARLVRTVVHEASVSSVAFAPSGHTIISGSIDGGLLITRENQSSMRVRGYAGAIDVAILIPDGQVAVSDALRRLRIYSADGLVTNGDAELETRARALRVSADAKRLVVVPRAGAPSRAPELWDLVRHQRVSLLSGHVGDVWTARFARDVLLTAGADGSVRMWDSSTGELLHTYQAASRTMFDATLDPDGEFVVAGGGDGVIRFWDRQSGRMVWQLSAHRSTVAGLHFEDRELITRGFGGDISRWTLPPARSVISEWNRR